MAATDIDIIWNQVSGTEVMIAVREAGYTVRCGRILGMTSANTTSDKALTDAIVSSGKVPPTHPDVRFANWPLRYVIARGDSQTTGLVWAHYAPQAFSGSPVERFAIEVGGAVQYEPTERLWETGEPFLVKLPDPDNPISVATVNETLSTADPKVSLQSLGHPSVAKTIILYGLFASVPPQLEALENCVNALAWPPPSPGFTRLGLSPRPIGYWLIAPYHARWSDRDGLYQVSVAVNSRGRLPGEDWSDYKFPVDPTTGKFLSPNRTLMNRLATDDYLYGLVNNVEVLKAGQYRLANFAAALGPLIQNTSLVPDTPFNALGA